MNFSCSSHRGNNNPMRRVLKPVVLKELKKIRMCTHNGMRLHHLPERGKKRKYKIYSQIVIQESLFHFISWSRLLKVKLNLHRSEICLTLSYESFWNWQRISMENWKQKKNQWHTKTINAPDHVILDLRDPIKVTPHEGRSLSKSRFMTDGLVIRANFNSNFKDKGTST